MNQAENSREKLERDLGRCESRMDELVKAGRSEDFEGDLDALGSELKSCKLELDNLENRSGDDWEEAKHGVVRRLSELQKSLGLGGRRLI